jgi:hypothetical protein
VFVHELFDLSYCELQSQAVTSGYPRALDDLLTTLCVKLGG